MTLTPSFPCLRCNSTSQQSRPGIRGRTPTKKFRIAFFAVIIGQAEIGASRIGQSEIRWNDPHPLMKGPHQLKEMSMKLGRAHQIFASFNVRLSSMSRECPGLGE